MWKRANMDEDEEPLHAEPIVIANKTLSYSGHDCRMIPLSLNKMFGTKIECLDLSYNRLKSLAGLTGFPSLRDLILDNNKISNLQLLPYLSNLATLSLNNNEITDLSAALTQIVRKTPNIIYLSLLGNPVCPDSLSNIFHSEADYQRYRYFVLFHLPKLKFLDSRCVTNTEREEAKLRGQYLQVRTPRSFALSEIRMNPFKYASLPQSSASRQQHKGVYGKCSYKYTGKHSEGNRFICNNDL